MFFIFKILIIGIAMWRCYISVKFVGKSKKLRTKFYYFTSRWVWGREWEWRKYAHQVYKDEKIRDGIKIIMYDHYHWF